MEILKLLADSFQLPNIPLPISVIQEVFVPLVSALHTAEMLDRTPILLRSGRNLRHVVQDAIGISAILTVDLLDQVQVGKMVAVKSEIVRSTHRGNAINREAYPLVGRTDQIQ